MCKVRGRFSVPALARWVRVGGLGSIILLAAGLAVQAQPANDNFSSAMDLGSAPWGLVTVDNTGATAQTAELEPHHAGYPANASVWYQWTAPQDGEVEMDTLGSSNLDTVLAVYTGTTLSGLSQVAADDDLYPINRDPVSSSAVPLAQRNITSSGDYAGMFGPGSSQEIRYFQPYYGPSGLRFNARGGTLYYIAVDTKKTSATGPISLSWAYKPSGVFRFATEDFDLLSLILTNIVPPMPLYQAAQTESLPPRGNNNDANSTLLTYYNYNAPGVLVTVTRAAGSFGRVKVDYTTVPGTDPSIASQQSYDQMFFGDQPAYDYYTNIVYYVNLDGSPGTNAFGDPLPPGTNVIAGDYSPVSGTLVFDDFEMSKTILVPINSSGGYLSNPFISTNVLINGQSVGRLGGGQRNLYYNTEFGLVLTNARLDELEDWGSVSPPRVDNQFGVAMVRILNSEADPYGPDLAIGSIVTNATPVLDTNTMTYTTNYDYVTNYVQVPPTNALFSFEKNNYRVPADVNDPNASTWTKVTLYVERSGTNGEAATLNYRVNNDLGYDRDNREEMNNQFPLQPGSDYAVPTPPEWPPIRGTNSDFDLAQGTISFPATPAAGSSFQPLTFTIPTSSLTRFNKDFRIELYEERSVNGRTVPVLPGMVAETTVTILFNDQNPPAGSVDELYNADFNSDLALPPEEVPQTTPANDPNPGVAGEVYSLVVLTNDETLIAGNFLSYNGIGRGNIALVDTNGNLDAAFDPGTGSDGAINAVAQTASGQLIIGGSFSSYNGSLAPRMARVNPDGSFDSSFNPGSGADDIIRAVAVQSDGKILIGGDFTHVDGVVRNHLARLNVNGSLDTTFDPGDTFDGPVYSLAVPPDRVLSINRTASGGTNEDDQAITLGVLTSGTLTVNYDMLSIPDDMRIFYGDTNVAAGTGVQLYDTGYISGSGQIVLPFGPVNGAAGLLTTNLLTIVMNPGGSTNAGTAWNYSATVSVPQVSGGILVGGRFHVAGQLYTDIARVRNNGLLDTSFDPGTGPDNAVFALAWQLNNQILAGGVFTHVNGNSCNRIVRLNPDGSIDTTNFFVGSGADDVVYNITPDVLDDTIYVGGAFSSINGTHRYGFARLYSNGTVDTTFLDTAYNQFAGLKRIYSWDLPAVFTSGIERDGKILIGGSFNQVGGGQADTNVCNSLDMELGYNPSFGDTNLWVEPKTRDGVRNRSGFARLIGGATPGPGNIALGQSVFSANKSQSALSVSLVRANGMLGPVSANFQVQPGLAQSGRDYIYNGTAPLYWEAWDYLTHPTREHSEGLSGANGFLVDPYGLSLTKADALINDQSEVTVSIIKDTSTAGNLSAQFQLANPSYADNFYLGGENIPLGGALGASSSPFTLVDDTQKPGTFSFSSASFVATNISSSISVLRSNGVYGIVSMRYSTSNGTAVAGIDYNGLTNAGPLVFQTGVMSNGFNVLVKQNGFIYTNAQEKTVNLYLSQLGTTAGAAFGVSNAVLRLVNPNYPGYLSLSDSNYTGTISGGVVSFTVNRVAGSLGSLSVQYGTTNGPSATNGVDYIGSTNLLTWDSGDVSARTISIPLLNPGAVGGNKAFGVSLRNPTLNGTNAPVLFAYGSATNLFTAARMTISNDNSYGTLQFSSSIYLVDENGGYATLTVLRTGGAVGTDSVCYATSDGSHTAAGVNYVATNGVLTFAPGQLAASFRVPILNDNAVDGAPDQFYFQASLFNPTNATLGAATNATVQIVDAQSFNQPPGSPDPGFDPATSLNGNAFALALQPDGRILVGGNFTAVGTTSENYLARLNTDGSLDTTFLNNLSAADAPVLALACQSDGRVLIGGAFTSVNGVARRFVARLMTDGTVDTSFNPGSGADNNVNALAATFLADGTNFVRKIYLGGGFGSVGGVSSPGLARLNDDGSPDPEFNVGSGADGQVYALAVYPTNSPCAGKVLIGGAFTNFNGVALGHFGRLNADGSLDLGFDAILGSGADAAVRAITIEPDGRVLVGGNFTNFNGMPRNHVIQLNPDGTLDTNFTANASDSVEAIAIQPDNRIVLVGQFTQCNDVTRNHITRLMPDGTTDPTINFGDGANGDVDALVLQPADQMMVIGGAFTRYDDEPHKNIARVYGGSTTGSGQFEFSSGNFQVHETGVYAPITIRRTGGTSGTNADGSGDVFVNFATSDGTAVSNINYVGQDLNVDFPAGEVVRTVIVPVLDDAAITADLTVNLSLTNPTPPAGIGNQPAAVLTILNDDNGMSFSSSSYTVLKNVVTGRATIDIVRQGGTNDTATVDFYTTTNGTAIAGTDYTPTNATLTFAPGQADASLQIGINNNGLVEGNRTVTMVLSNAVNTTLLDPSNSTLTIIDTTPAPGQLHFAATNFYANEGDTNAYVTITRTNGSVGIVSVDYQTLPGTALPSINYVSTSGTLTFGSGETTKTIVVPLVDNNIIQGTVDLSVILSNSTGGASLIDPTNAIVSIFDNDNGFFFAAPTNVVRESDGQIVLDVMRAGATNITTSVDYATHDGTALAGVNYTAASGTLTFSPGQTLKGVVIPILYDPQIQGSLNFTTTLSNPSAGSEVANPNTNVVIIQDADAGLSFTNDTMSVIRNIGYATVTVVTTNTSIEPVVVDTNTIPLSVQYFTVDGTARSNLDYTGVSGTLVFTNGIGTNTFTIPILGAGTVTGDRQFGVVLANPTAPGQLIWPSNQTVTIQDSLSGFKFSSAAYTILKSGGAIRIDVQRSGFTNNIATVDFAATNGSAIAGIHYYPTNGTLVFTNGVTDQSFLVQVIDTTVVQPDKSVLLQLFDPSSAVLLVPNAATLTIHDNSGSYVVPSGSALVSESGAGAPNGIIDSNETVTVLFGFRDAGGTDVSNLVATLLSTNGIGLPTPASQTYGPLAYLGHSVSMPFTFTAHGTNGQEISATFQLSDNGLPLGVALFGYTLGSRTYNFTNSARIVINDKTYATPYPSAITLSNLVGSVIRASVTLTNINHPSPGDIDALLVSPDAKDTLFMAHAGAQNAVSNVTIYFDDAAAGFLPQSGQIVSGTNRPTSYLPVPTFP